MAEWPKAADARTFLFAGFETERGEKLHGEAAGEKAPEAYPKVL